MIAWDTLVARFSPREIEEIIFGEIHHSYFGFPRARRRLNYSAEGRPIWAV